MRDEGPNPRIHMWLVTIVSSIISVAAHDDASSEGSLSFTMPAFALPWVW